MPATIYTVIDVETTGKGILGNRITEICIVRMQEGEILDTFTSLVNPECPIPSFITGLTGIDDDMVRTAPIFSEIADRVLELTTEAIFVAHNVSFDYNVVKEEFRKLGKSFVRKKLCTVRLSRKLIPGMASYSLGKLCRSLNIPLEDRHRAKGDTDATVILFTRLLGLDTDRSVIKKFLNVRSREATLPPHLPLTAIEALPATTGVYLFKDKQGKVVYVGKAKNIKQRVTSHFYNKKNKEYALCQETYSIDYEETGSELVALLVEAAKIQHYYPVYNQAQKTQVSLYGVITYTNRKGVLQLGIDRVQGITSSFAIFYTRQQAIETLERLSMAYQLCPRYCGLQHTHKRCSHYKVKNCKGICEGKESTALYNMRVHQALKEISSEQQSFVIKEKGRTIEEQSFVMIEQGVYKGYGFIGEEAQISKLEDCEHYLTKQKHTYHTTKIIKSYLKKNGNTTVLSMNT